MFRLLKTRIILAALEAVLSQVDPMFLKEMIDDLIDKVEDHYSESQPIMAACNIVRETFSIPDDIGGDED